MALSMEEEQQQQQQRELCRSPARWAPPPRCCRGADGDPRPAPPPRGRAHHPPAPPLSPFFLSVGFCGCLGILGEIFYLSPPLTDGPGRGRRDALSEPRVFPRLPPAPNYRNPPPPAGAPRAAAPGPPHSAPGHCEPQRRDPPTPGRREPQRGARPSRYRDTGTHPPKPGHRELQRQDPRNPLRGTGTPPRREPQRRRPSLHRGGLPHPLRTGLRGGHGKRRAPPSSGPPRAAAEGPPPYRGTGSRSAGTTPRFGAPRAAAEGPPHPADPPLPGVPPRRTGSRGGARRTGGCSECRHRSRPPPERPAPGRDGPRPPPERLGGAHGM